MKKLLFFAIFMANTSVFAQTVLVVPPTQPVPPIPIEPLPQVGLLRITWPINRMVFQQNTNGEATIDIAGQMIGSATLGIILRYRITRLNTKDGMEGTLITNNYETITSAYFTNNISSTNLKTFLFSTQLAKGWYRLELKIQRPLNTTPRAKTEIIFGIGDNYGICGQSNAAGYQDNNDAGIVAHSENYMPYHAVSVIDRKELITNANSIKIEGLPINNKIKDDLYEQKGFSKLEKTKSGIYSPIYPKGQGSWCWGPLASKLIDNQTDTPIMFFNSAIRGSEIGQWSDKTRGDYWVYKQFRSTLQMYLHTSGIKAVLWHQGERDAETNTNSGVYTGGMNSVITQSRTDIGSANLSWFSSEVSYYYANGEQNKSTGGSRSSLNLAQQAVWNNGDKKFQGIFTDDLGASFRNNILNLHFTGETHFINGGRWYDKNPSQATPIEGKRLLNINIQLINNDTQYRLTPIVPSGVSVSKYFWVENENGIYTPINSNLNQNYIDVPVTQAGPPKFITCYAGESTGEDMGNATDGWNLKFYATQPFIIPGYEGAAASIVPSKNLLGYSEKGGDNSFILSATNLNWTTSTNSSWISFQNSETTNGSDGNYQIRVSVVPNTSTTTRTAYVTVQEDGGGVTETIEIYQEGIDDCNSSLNLVSPQNDYLTSVTKKTATGIQATNKLIVNSTKIDYKAGNSITLNPGFKVENGVIFKAQIEGCVVDVPWQNAIIGNIDGTTDISSGTLTIDGTGNVSGNADNTQFYNKPFSGDVTVIARIVNITAIDAMRGGIMLRSNTNQDAKMYEFILDGNGNIGKLKRRNTGGNVDFVGFAPAPTSNTWLKMTKIGNSIKCFISTDNNVTYNELVGFDVQTDNDLGASFLVGFVGYNSGNSQNCVVSFDNMSVNSVPVN